MKRGVDERQGRLLLGILLVLCLLAQIVQQWGEGLTVLLYWELSLPLVLTLLPTLVIFWAVWRGCWPALVVFVIRTVIQLGDAVSLFQYRWYEFMPPRATALTLITLLQRLTVVLCVFRQQQVITYWQARQYRRKRSDLVLEIVLFALSLLAYFGGGVLAELLM